MEFRRVLFRSHQVEPPTELESHLMEMPDLSEPQVQVQLDRGVVVCVDARNHDVLLHGGSSSHERSHQHAAEPPTPAICTDMDTVLNAVPIARPSAKLAEAAETGNAGCISRHQQGKAA